MASTIHLPLDIIHNILINLPVKSLCRFKIVCKSWNATISNHQFLKIHHQNPKDHDLFLLSRSPWSNEIHLVKFENQNLHVEEVLTNCIPTAFYNILFAGDGLVLLRTTLGEEEEEACVLWNPSSQKQTTIWHPDWCEFLDILWADYGFCHDPNLDDYKIVIISKTYYSVFSCKHRTWTEKQNFNYNIDTYTDPGLFVDGFTFWLGWDKDEDSRKEIIYYDHRDDMFKKLHKPKLLEHVDAFSFTKIRGRLCLYNIIESGMVVRMHIWMMEGHVDLCHWSELMIIENIPVVDCCIFSIRPLFFTEKNEIIVMFREPCQHAMVYSSSRKTFEKYSGPEELLDHMIPYVDSMFFPIEAEEEA